jgi:hypothetical protein
MRALSRSPHRWRVRVACQQSGGWWALLVMLLTHGHALVGPLLPRRPDQAGHFTLCQRLGKHPNALPEDLSVLLVEKLANERGQTHPEVNAFRKLSDARFP